MLLCKRSMTILHQDALLDERGIECNCTIAAERKACVGLLIRECDDCCLAATSERTTTFSSRHHGCPARQERKREPVSVRNDDESPHRGTRLQTRLALQRQIENLPHLLRQCHLHANRQWGPRMTLGGQKWKRRQNTVSLCLQICKD